MTAISPAVRYENRTGLDILIASLAMLLLAVQLLNLATFNHQPDKIRLAIDALSLLGYGGLVAAGLIYARASTMVHFLGLVLFCGAASISIALDPEHAKISSFIGDVTSPMLLGILTMRRKPAPGTMALWFLWGAAVLAALAGAGLALTGTAYLKAGTTRLALIAGGDTGLHPSAYATACFFLALLVLWRARIGFNWLTPLILALVAYVIFRYEVRTVWLMLVVFAGYGMFAWLARRSPLLIIAAGGLALLGVALVLFALASSNFDIGHFSSGRTLIYAERLRVITARGPIQVLFGTGSGTDLMRGVSAWRWDEKNSHNDLMTVTIELGLVGLVGFLLMLGAALWSLPSSHKGWLLMIATSSFVSNGVLFRPSLGPVLILISWLSAALYERSREQAAEDEEDAWFEHEARDAPQAGVLAYAGRLARPDA